MDYMLYINIFLRKKKVLIYVNFMVYMLMNSFNLYQSFILKTYLLFILFIYLFQLIKIFLY